MADMATSLTMRKTTRLAAQPEVFSASMAHVMTVEGHQEVVLGQAWLAAPNKLVTCGHVVEQFVRSPSSLIVKFPGSGNKYPVREVRLHPSFVRQPDQLVKFDASVLHVELNYPEDQADPLPIKFEKSLNTFQSMAAIRYPVHLGQFTADPNPLAQIGRYLGPLRKHDSFHLLHDLALAAGDSGAAIFDDASVVAIHCGDTATLPGLNLPTTSIRLALWVDALRELGIVETIEEEKENKWAIWIRSLSIFLMFGVVAFAATLITSWQLGNNKENWALKQPALLPITVAFNKSIYDYKCWMQDIDGDGKKDPGSDEMTINIVPQSDCFMYLFQVEVDEYDRPTSDAIFLYPAPGLKPYVPAGTMRTINEIGKSPLGVSDTKSKLHFVLLKNDKSLLFDMEEDKQANLIKCKYDVMKRRIDNYASEEPGKVLHLVMDGPKATSVSPPGTN